MNMVNELIDALDTVLPQIAGEQRIVLDRDLARMLGTTEAEGSPLWGAIEMWDRRNHEIGMPLCSCLLHSRDSILPGSRFTAFARSLGISDAERPSVVWEARVKAWSFWSGVFERDKVALSTETAHRTSH